MATTKRESPLGLGKDKKPTRSLARISTTPSSIPKLGRRSAPTTPPTSTSKSIIKTRSSPDKNVRKKPSSTTSRVTKKHDTPSKAPLIRRRSFGKAPSISNVKPAPVVTKKPASSTRTSTDRQSKASLKPLRTGVRRRTTPPPPPSPKRPASTPTVMPFVEVDLELEDRYGEVEEIANIGSDEDLVPFDQMEFPEMNAHAYANAYAYDSGNVVNHDPAEERKDEKVEEEVKATQQDEESNNPSSGDIEIVEEGKQEAEVVSAPRAKPNWQQQVVKKESGVSNDVIEETASKLLEKRKNKVRALVGAFETVISSQD